MNSKAIKRQLLAAIAMVLVAALALGSSTYAWFVASGTVTATGMNVQAQSEAGLVIRYGTGKWGTSAEAVKTKTESAKLKPTSTIDGTAWYYAGAQLASEFGAKSDTRTTVATNKYDEHFLMEEFQIRSSSADSAVTGLYVKSVTVTGYAANPMNTALRVGVAYRTASNGSITDDTTDKFVIFAPVKIDETDANKPSYSYTVYKSSTDTGTGVTALAADAGSASASNLVKTGVSIPSAEESCVKVQVYIWYEGEDHNLYSDNYVAQDLSVSVDFASIGTAATT